MSASDPTLDIIIVNWNSGDQLRACLSSIETANQIGFGLISVVVVDNASEDGSAEGLHHDNLPLRIVKCAENIGFAAACNRGATDAASDYLLFLNPDTRLEVSSLLRPLNFIQNPAHRDVGICGIQLLDEGGNIALTCSKFPTLKRFFAQAIGINKMPGCQSTGPCMRGWNHGSTQIVDQVIGAFFMVRRALFESLCGFDERFFVYFEEVDFSLRAKNIGWLSVYLNDGHAFHAGGGTSRNIKATRLFYSLRSRLLYGFKHFGCVRAWCLVLLTAVVEPLTRTVFAIGRGNVTELRDTWQGYGMLVRDLPAALRNSGVS